MPHIDNASSEEKGYFASSVYKLARHLCDQSPYPSINIAGLVKWREGTEYTPVANAEELANGPVYMVFKLPTASDFANPQNMEEKLEKCVRYLDGHLQKIGSKLATSVKETSEPAGSFDIFRPGSTRGNLVYVDISPLRDAPRAGKEAVDIFAQTGKNRKARQEMMTATGAGMVLHSIWHGSRPPKRDGLDILRKVAHLPARHETPQQIGAMTAEIATGTTLMIPEAYDAIVRNELAQARTDLPDNSPEAWDTFKYKICRQIGYDIARIDALVEPNPPRRDQSGPPTAGFRF